MAVHRGGDSCLCRQRRDLPLVEEGVTDMAAAADDRDNSVSVGRPVQYAVRSLSRDHPDRLEVSESEGQRRH